LLERLESVQGKAGDVDSPMSSSSTPMPSPVDAAGLALRFGLLALSQTLSGRVPFEETLTQVARITVQAISGADGAGVTLLEKRCDPMIVASAPFVREIDTIQHRLGQGPCISAIADNQALRSGSLISDKRWPKFASRVGNLGVSRAQSVLSLPLRLPGRVIGSLNVYAHVEHAFSEDSVRRGEDFAAAAAVTVSNMQALDQAQLYASQLEEALHSRATIDQAIGIIRSRTGGTTEEALDSLRAISQRENKRLSAVAELLVDQSAGRARARHSDP
jgi:GAF domain-containing protein